MLLYIFNSIKSDFVDIKFQDFRLPGHERYEIHPQEKSSLIFCAKSKTSIVTLYVSKNVTVGIKIQLIFSSFRKDKTSDMDLRKHQQLSVSI